MIIHKNPEIDNILKTIDFYAMHEWFLINNIRYQYGYRASFLEISASLEEVLNDVVINFIFSERGRNMYTWIKSPAEEITVTYHHYGDNEDKIYFINAAPDKILKILNKFLKLKAFL